MSERAEALARQLEQVVGEFTRAVEECSEGRWRAKTSGEGWSVGVVAHHVAAAHLEAMGIIQGVANGQGMPPITLEMIDQGNAKHAEEHANCTKAETLDLLKRNGSSAVAAVRALSDEQLDRSTPMAAFGGAPV